MTSAVAHELGFWQKFVQTERFLEGWCGDYPTPELRPLVRDFLLARPYAQVLDVGSGVVSLLHGTAKNLTAVDPLGAEYRELFDYGLHRLAAPEPIAAEELPYEAEFDVVHISNALDHCQDPLQAIYRLVRAVRKGGWLIVQSFEDEGWAQRWSGFHQWNLRVEGIRMVALDRDGRGCSLPLGDEVHLYAVQGDRRWFIWLKQKQ